MPRCCFFQVLLVPSVLRCVAMLELSLSFFFRLMYLYGDGDDDDDNDAVWGLFPSLCIS